MKTWKIVASVAVILAAVGGGAFAVSWMNRPIPGPVPPDPVPPERRSFICILDKDHEFTSDEASAVVQCLMRYTKRDVRVSTDADVRAAADATEPGWGSSDTCYGGWTVSEYNSMHETTFTMTDKCGTIPWYKDLGIAKTAPCVFLTYAGPYLNLDDYLPCFTEIGHPNARMAYETDIAQ